jgi:hypothetical protein
VVVTPPPATTTPAKDSTPWGWIVLGGLGIGAAFLLMSGVGALANNPSEYIKRGDSRERRARLRRAALEDVKRLEEAARRGWNVADEELAKARRYVEAFTEKA